MQNILITPTPDSIPVEVVEQFTRAADTFNNLGVFMAVLFVIALFALIILVIFWMNRNSTSTALSLISNVNAQKDKEIADLKAERDLRDKQHLEGLSVIHDQAVRTNDLFEAMNKRGLERDGTQQRLADDLSTIITSGSRPVQEILSHVKQIAALVTRIDGQTADWQTIIQAVTPLLSELAALRSEAKKHDSKPIPTITDTQTIPPLEAAPQ